MDPRARRFAIREYLGTARAALDRGDRRAALDALNAALELDPDYLAAQALKERVERAADLAREFPSSGSMQRPTPADIPPQPNQPAAGGPLEPLISAEGWVRFETRARARRVEKRAAAARVLIERRRFAQAREIMEEIREIDPAHPDLVSLSIELDAAEHLRPTSTWHWGPALAAVGVFGALLFGARYVELPGSQPAPSPAARVTSVPEPIAPSELPTPVDPVSTPEALALVEPNTVPSAGEAVTPPVEPPRAAPVPVPVEPRPTREPAVALPAPVPARTEPSTVRQEDPPTPVATAGATAASTPSPAPDINLPPIAPAVTPASLPGAMPAGPAPGAPVVDQDAPAARAFGRDPAPAAVRAGGAVAIPTVPDEERVRRTLQQYQRAYEALDAQSAQAVWPRVDGVALQRAFDGLSSQRLMFDNCQVQVRGTFGSAVCHGTTRYVPKVGSREPRVEPRTWTFALRKAGDEWQIDSARAER